MASGAGRRRPPASGPLDRHRVLYPSRARGPGAVGRPSRGAQRRAGPGRGSTERRHPGRGEPGHGPGAPGPRCLRGPARGRRRGAHGPAARVVGPTQAARRRQRRILHQPCDPGWLPGHRPHRHTAAPAPGGQEAGQEPGCGGTRLDGPFRLYFTCMEKWTSGVARSALHTAPRVASRQPHREEKVRRGPWLRLRAPARSRWAV